MRKHAAGMRRTIDWRVILNMSTLLFTSALFRFGCTNNAAERAIRGMVIARKVWGGNRTWEGAATQQILTQRAAHLLAQGKDASRAA